MGGPSLPFDPPWTGLEVPGAEKGGAGVSGSVREVTTS